jgi:hypothetical protein
MHKNSQYEIIHLWARRLFVFIHKGGRIVSGLIKMNQIVSILFQATVFGQKMMVLIRVISTLFCRAKRSEASAENSSDHEIPLYFGMTIWFILMAWKVCERAERTYSLCFRFPGVFIF